MYHSQTSATVPGRPQGFEPAIGQIDLLDAQGETLRSWRIQSSKCTVGSSADCTIQLDPAQAAPLHASLIFGKRHTLLRAIAPTKIANRNVREWLIDHPTEISLGSTRIVVHPCIGVMATVVQAEQLLDRAARLCSDSTPVIPVVSTRSTTPAPVALPPINQPAVNQPAVDRPAVDRPAVDRPAVDRPAVDRPAVDRPAVDRPAVALVSAGDEPPLAVSNTEILSSLSSNETKERLERIEQMLLSLQSSLDRVQETIHVEPKESDELLSDSVADHFDSFGKTLFSTLNDQFSNQTERHESLLSNLSEQVAQQFATIDQQLQYVTESTSHQSMQLGELLERAIAEQSLIEARFSEVAANRDELMQALHVLHNEIANAHDTYANSFQSLAQSVASVHEQVQAPVYNQIASPVQDQILAESLEKAQAQIQQYNLQLRELETERQNAEQRIVALADSLASQPNRPAPANSDNQLGQVSALASNDPLPQFSIDDRYSVDQPYPIDPRFAVDDNNQAEEQYGAEGQYRAEEPYPDETPAEKPQLPSWFTNSEPVSAESTQEVSAFSRPDLSQYSDHLNPDQQGHSADHGYNDDAQRVVTPVGETYSGHGSFAQDMYPAEPAYIPETDTGSISERLQRMIVDADARRGSSSGQISTNSRRWSQTYGPNSVPSKEHPEPSQVEVLISQEQETSGYLATDEAFSEPEEDHLSQPIANITETSEVTSTNEAPAASTDESEDESQEESIEEYMQRLLHRVRTGSDSAPSPASSSRAPASVSTPTSSGKSRVAASLGLDVEKANPQPETLAPLTQESFVPRQQAPEQRNDLTALRELANSNARRAISRSDSQRTSSAFFFKLAVTGVAVTSAVALLMLNGLQLNMPFAGMIAAIIVAFLWGFDCLNHFKRRQSEVKNAPASNSHSPAMNSIQVGASDVVQEHWRPTPV
jgi:hypothetical protein